MVTALERWGSKKFPLSQLLERAIFYSEEGFPVAERGAWITEAALSVPRVHSWG